MDRVQATGRAGKRKATDGQDNERLSKRLSLLNLGSYYSSAINQCRLRSSSLLGEITERNGEKLYVPVEQPSERQTRSKTSTRKGDDDSMQLDDTKHKVYIYDLDAELSESDSDDGKLVFLPDIEKHLRETRIPPSVLANSEGELAGNKQLVLYNVPSSLTVPQEHDSVRKAIIEARARVRARQQNQTEAEGKYMGVPNGTISGNDNTNFGHRGNWGEGSSSSSSTPKVDEYDPDAMDLG